MTSDTATLWVVIIVFAILCAMIGRTIGKPKGREGQGIVLGLLLSWLGVLLIYVLPPSDTLNTANTTHRHCPGCRELMRRDAAVCPHCRTTSAAWVPCVGYRANDGTKDMGAATLVTPGPKGLAVDGTKLTDTGPLMIAAKCSLVSVLADTRPVDVLFVTAKGAVQSVFAGLAPGASASAPTRQNGGVIVGSAGWAQRENLSVGSTVVVCGPGELAPPLLLNQL